MKKDPLPALEAALKKATKRPWRLDIRPGYFKGPPSRRGHYYATATIRAPSVIIEGAHAYNEKTKEFDVPVCEEILKIGYEDEGMHADGSPTHEDSLPHGRQKVADAEFIALARNELPAILRELKALRKENRALRFGAPPRLGRRK